MQLECHKCLVLDCGNILTAVEFVPLSGSTWQPLKGTRVLVMCLSCSIEGWVAWCSILDWRLLRVYSWNARLCERLLDFSCSWCKLPNFPQNSLLLDCPMFWTLWEKLINNRLLFSNVFISQGILTAKVRKFWRSCWHPVVGVFHYDNEYDF